MNDKNSNGKLFWMSKVEELRCKIEKVRKRDREVRTRFYKAFYDEKPTDITKMITSLRYFFKKLDDLYDKSAIINQYIISEKAMEKDDDRNDYEKIKDLGLPHKKFIKAKSIEKMVDRLCECNIYGDVSIEDIVNEADMNGIEPTETYELLGWMKRFNMVDEVEKNLFRSTSGLIPLQPDIVELMKRELKDK